MTSTKVHSAAPVASAKQPDTMGKFLSFVLQHQPTAIELQFDSQAWADIDQLLDNAIAAQHSDHLA